MAGLFGFIATFLGSSLFWIAGGVPFLPTQTIWVNFSVQVAAAFGLGFGAPTKGLMDRKPRPADAPILSQRMLIYLAVVGLFMGLGTLLVLELATRQYGEDVGRSMALATFSFMNVAFALGTKDLRESVFTMDTLADRTLMLGTGAGILITLLASQLGMLNRLLGTVPLTWEQWLVCAVMGLLVLFVSEIRKFVAPDLYANEP